MVHISENWNTIDDCGALLIPAMCLISGHRFIFLVNLSFRMELIYSSVLRASNLDPWYLVSDNFFSVLSMADVHSSVLCLSKRFMIVDSRVV